MAGTSLDLTYDDRTQPIVNALKRVIKADKNPLPLHNQIGEYLVRSTQDRFDDQVSPEGSRWQSIDPVTMAFKRIKKILTESSRLRDSVVYQATDDNIEWGTNVIYGGIHQDGGKTKAHDIRAKKGGGLMFPGLDHPLKVVHHPGSIIPARPFIGISDEDAGEILDRIHDYYAEAVRP